MSDKPRQMNLWEGHPIMDRFDGVRRVWQHGVCWLSVVDVIEVLTESPDPGNYWRVLKHRLAREGAEQTITDCNELKMEAADGKMRLTDVATTQQVLRIIQSVPSPNAEPFKQWLAQVGRERLEEEENPELGVMRSLSRAGRKYAEQGKSPAWIADRVDGVISRKEFIDRLHAAVAKSYPAMYGQATNTVYRQLTSRDANGLRHDMHLGPRENIRDNLNRVILNFISIAEALCADELGQQKMIPASVALEIVDRVSGMVGVSVDVLQQQMGIDLVTGRRLIGPAN